MQHRPWRASTGGPFVVAVLAATLVHLVVINGMPLLDRVAAASNGSRPAPQTVSVRTLPSIPSQEPRDEIAPLPGDEVVSSHSGAGASTKNHDEGSIVYLTASDVDEVAKPRSDFVIRADRLPRETLLVAEVTLWISARGRIVHWQIDHVDASAPWVQEVFSGLTRTRMEPARLRGQAVASTLHIQVALDNRVL